ncbi:uncharacterized protein LOC112050479 [Bicyclus anynana]|uniref:Uncharacterized protein LOC112050479 n=1 Tax=Bicyclus anynana TaxID=110368 RepID=A0ABM3LXY4_BICAN|nr:uncharacterized protein LOC112050479 [Bicyclus anynana]
MGTLSMAHFIARALQTLPGVTTNVISENNWTKTSHSLGSLSTFDHNNRSNVILHLSRCYLLLLQQCDYINGMFGFRILLGALVYLLEMVMLINLIIRLTLGTMIKTLFVSASEYYEALQELRALVISRPVRFNAVHFYTLDHSTMLAMGSAIVTYTIILLQNIH